MGIQTHCLRGTEHYRRIKSLLSTLKSPMTYTVIAVFIIASLLAFEYTFAKDATNNASLTTSIASPSRNHVSPAKRGLISNEDIEELVSHVGALNKEKSKLDNEWRIERNKHDSMKIRIDDSQKTIRLEMDEVLLNNSPRERLDDLLSQHDVLTRDEKGSPNKFCNSKKKTHRTSTATCSSQP